MPWDLRPESFGPGGVHHSELHLYSPKQPTWAGRTPHDVADEGFPPDQPRAFRPQTSPADHDSTRGTPSGRRPRHDAYDTTTHHDGPDDTRPHGAGAGRPGVRGQPAL